MLANLRKLGGAVWLESTGAAGRARRNLHGGRYGLRIVGLHDVVSSDLDRFRRFLDYAVGAFDIVDPAVAADLVAGRATDPADRDQLLLTFDDGFESQHRVAAILADRGLRALFFVMPSLIDRSIDEWIAWHASAGRRAFPVWSLGSRRGLSRVQILEMVAMGHVIGGHNDAHRDLGTLDDPAEIRGEIDRAVDGVEELTGLPCADFAFAFGRPRNMTPVAVSRAVVRCRNVYAYVRGLNLAGTSPRLLLRDDIHLREPWRFQRLCLAGGIDGLWSGEVRELAALAGSLPAAGGAGEDDA